jgi:glycosyltransferase involved in cell wall biosynthesis
MFASSVKAFDYNDPWNLPINKRLSYLAARSNRVAYFYEESNNSTFRYRAYNMAQVLNRTPDSTYSASYFFNSDRVSFDLIAELADVLVICRSRYCDSLRQLVQKFRLRRKPIYFDIDDLVFEPKFAHEIINALGQNREHQGTWDYWFAYVSRMGCALKLTDGVITTNEYLAQQINSFSNLPVAVIPNFMNFEQLAISDQLFEEKRVNQFQSSGRVQIGYFSGSPSHSLDFALASTALRELLGERDNIELVIAGYLEVGSEFNAVRHRIRYVPFRDYVNLQREYSRVEINIVPLQSTIFSNCKSELKFFEAGATGTITVASPTSTYSSAIEDSKNGFLAASHSWHQVLSRVLDNLGQYKNVAHQARLDALTSYSASMQYGNITAALQKLAR